jgi:cysteinyl-tRNA synthetase
LRLHNALTGRLEALTPIRPGEVRMYACGLTVSDDAHLGHGRSAAVFDLLRRVLRTRGLRVVYVRNVTDVDDKIIARARPQAPTKRAELWYGAVDTSTTGLPTDPVELARKYIARHDEDMERLRVQRADIEPRASEHIPAMIEFIRVLEMRGATYEKDGAVYFRLSSAPGFGELARMRGAEPEPDDFVLWKTSLADEPGWESPWGRGRPGWHIECSTMSTSLLGEVFDIHGGGADLHHPHHDAEIAQCRARSGKMHAQIWMHTGLVLIEQEKMSKSTGRFFTLRDVYARYDPAAIRYYFFRTHYREPITFTASAIDEAEKSVAAIESFTAASARVVGPGGKRSGSVEEKRLLERARTARADVLSALEDDLDTPRALAVIDEMIAYGQEYLATGEADPQVLGQVEEILEWIDELFDLRPERAITESRTAEVIEAVLRVRNKLRERALDDSTAAKTVNELTDMLQKLGIGLVDTPWGTRWRWE